KGHDRHSRLPGRRGEEEEIRVVITGASSGIGEALARHYAAQGAELALVARRRMEIAGKSYQADVTDARAMAAVAEDFGLPDLVIANAGVSAGTSGEDLRDMTHLRRLLEVNVTGVATTLAAFAPAMRKAGRGTLAAIASVAGFRGLAGNGAYSASKAAA